MKQSIEQLQAQYLKIRQASLDMCSTLSVEQCRMQPMVEVSPPWWNLAHTSWFFVRNVLQPFGGEVAKEDTLFDYVLNSYYASLGPRLEKNKRGLMTRPTITEVYHYRQSVDERVIKLIDTLANSKLEALQAVLKIGLEHEQQHQELFYTEIKYILFQNPPELREAYAARMIANNPQPSPILKNIQSSFIDIKGGMTEFGNLEKTWGWDNEFPEHLYYLTDFALNNLLVTNSDYLEFIVDGGYLKQDLWLDNGWNKVQQEQWYAPLYWEKIDNEWHIWTLTGMKKLEPMEPVCHVSFYEADAFATWRKSRLPTEREWEYAARKFDSQINVFNPNFRDPNCLHPKPISSLTDSHDNFFQMLGDVWEWTSSYYEPYPGYEPFRGHLKEYNQKFMDNQRVLRGGSCVSEPEHIRISYRNFWSPDTRFQFSGIRLAQNR